MSTDDKYSLLVERDFGKYEGQICSVGFDT